MVAGDPVPVSSSDPKQPGQGMVTVVLGGHSIRLVGSGEIPAMGLFAPALANGLGLVTDKVVADIGCGSGVLGLLALLCGAKRVIFNDIQSEAMGLVRRNLELNGFGSEIGSEGSRVDLRQESFETLDGRNVDLALFNPPQLPAFIGPSVGMEQPERVFRSGGDDGLGLLRVWLATSAAAAAAEQRISLSSLLGQDAVERTFDRAGFAFEIIARTRLAIRPLFAPWLATLTPDVLTQRGVQDMSESQAGHGALERQIACAGRTKEVRVYRLFTDEEHTE